MAEPLLVAFAEARPYHLLEHVDAVDGVAGMHVAGYLEGERVAGRVASVGDLMSLVRGSGVVAAGPVSSETVVRASHAVYSVSLCLGGLGDRGSVAVTAGLGPRARLGDGELAALFVSRMLGLYGASLVRAAARLALHSEGGVAVAALESVLTRPRGRRLVGLYASRGRVCVSYSERVVVVGSSGRSCYEGVVVVLHARRPVRVRVVDLDRAARKL